MAKHKRKQTAAMKKQQKRMKCGVKHCKGKPGYQDCMSPYLKGDKTCK